MSTPRRRRKDREPPNQMATLATVARTTDDVPNPVDRLTREPNHEDISRRDDQLYEERGCEHGRDREDWFQAERELRHLALLHSVVDRTLASEGPYAAA
jgi:hypothetical protein